MGIFDFKKKHIKWFDINLFLTLITMSLFGIFIIFGSTHNVPNLENYAIKQMVWLLVSIFAFFIIITVDYKKIKKIIPYIYGGLILLLLYLLLKGNSIKGANSWIRLGPVRFQPSELMKIVVVIMLADHLALKFGKINRIRDLFIPGLIVGAPFLLILKQPDLGTASVFIPIFMVMIFLAGCRKRIILYLICLGIFGSVTIFPFLKTYQKERILVFLGKKQETKIRGSDWNVKQSEITLGSGRVFGKGWGKGTQTEFQFLPEHHTDFIFSSLGEQLGIAGCLALFLGYVYLFRRTILLILDSEDNFSVLLIAGMITILITHILLNVGMNVQLLPVTGVPLPFMSYGGSFLLCNYIMFALIMNLKLRRFMF